MCKVRRVAVGVGNDREVPLSSERLQDLADKQTVAPTRGNRILDKTPTAWERGWEEGLLSIYTKMRRSYNASLHK